MRRTEQLSRVEFGEGIERELVKALASLVDILEVIADLLDRR